ncbi:MULTISPECIES: hypothetical protein [Mannheimia]|uniref:Uncharacterized protein n=1 Tax=Mannheimia pernigra TaxID=111844 RepID=A0ABD7A7L6_9PAST|nr:MULTISPECIES: hypothetical protein [Mannheimia]QLB42054.1 hypothetical protein HV560_04070 [Mannheimia pernigra]QTM00708.1 hypothetical protein GM698_03330 [Mannheimia sp. ZY171111]
MADHSQFISILENLSNPVISLKDLIEKLVSYTNRTPASIADKLEGLIFGFRKGGSHNQYDNAFVYCTVFEIDQRGERHSYEPMSNHFKDTFDHIKGYLNEVIADNAFNTLELTRFTVRGSEIAKLIKSKMPELLDKVPQTKIETMSQNQSDYISVYELIEWAREKSKKDVGFSANQLLLELTGKHIQTYKRSILTEKITYSDKQIGKLLLFAFQNNGYNEINFDDIPF